MTFSKENPKDGLAQAQDVKVPQLDSDKRDKVQAKSHLRFNECVARQVSVFQSWGNLALFSICILRGGAG